MSTRVTVVVPAYNAERYLEQTIESVLAQSFIDWELIIVNDGSKDATWDIIQSYVRRDPRILGLDQVNTGVSVARNNGAAVAGNDSQFLIFLDQDDIWELEILEALTSSLSSSPDCVCAYSFISVIDSNGHQIEGDRWEESCRNRMSIENGRLVTLAPDNPATFATFALGNCIPTPGSALIRRSVFERVGGFDPDDPQCQDWDLYIRLSRFGNFKFVFLPLIRYRIHADNVSGNRAKQAEMVMRLRRKSITSPENTPKQRAEAIAGFRMDQRHNLSDKLHYMQAALKERDLGGATLQFKASLGLFWRIMRGHP
jgi:glycosyltransferase involved in cell wall biosynthesis